MVIWTGCYYYTNSPHGAGWQWQTPLLKSMAPRLVSMNPVTALCFVCLISSFFLLTRYDDSRNARITGLCLLTLVLLTALLKFFFLCGWSSFQVDALLYTDQLEHDIPGGAPNRMAPNTAVCLFLSSVLLFTWSTGKKRAYVISQSLSILLFLLGLLSLLGYLYQAEKFYGLAFQIPMALHTGLCFFLFSLAFLFYTSDRGIMTLLTTGLSGSSFARILIPAAIIIPSFLGLLRLWGYWKGVYNNEFGVALYSIAIIIFFVAIVIYNALLLNKRDLLQQEVSRALKANEEQTRSVNEELEKRVREQTSELREIFERVKDGFVALDKDFRFTYLNKKALEIVQRSQDELIGKMVWEEFAAAIDSPTYFAYHKAMTTQEPVQVTDYYAPLDLWQESSIYPSANGLSIFVRDISEQKRNEKEVSEVRNLSNKLIDSLPGVFYFYDINGRFIRWNKQLEEVTGYSSDEIAVMHPVELFAPEDKEYITQRIMGVFEKGVNDAEATFMTKAGKRIPYYFKAVLIDYQGGPCLLGSGIDITERRQSELELKESEQKYKLLFESNPLPMWMLSLPEYKTIEVNDAAAQQYRYTRQEFLDLDIFKLRPDEDIEKLKQTTNREFRGLFHAGIWRHLRRDGTIIYVDVVTHDIYYEGKPVRLVLAHEVTEQYLAEEKLKESYDSIRQLTEYLQDIREQERLHISREIHDELGQLLTVLKMDVSWINRRTEEENAAVKSKLTDVLALIDKTVSTVRRIASELRPSLLDNLGLFAAMEWHVEEFEKRSGIEKEMHVPDEEIELPDAYKIGLFRIFQESLTNVGRHSEAKKVVVTLKKEANELLLTIADNGKGFDENQTKKKTLGLLGMKERTQGLGGSYNITSAVGKGTTVTVTLPLPAAQE